MLKGLDDTMSQLLETNSINSTNRVRQAGDGCVALVLHAHLPYVRHNEQAERLEERWFYEAMTETYLPLLDMFDRLERDRVPYRLTMTLTPTLLAMMDDPLMQLRYERYLSRSVELAQSEIARTAQQPELQAVADMYAKHWSYLLQRFRDWERSIIPQFKRHYEAGHLELMTCALTHAFLPFLKHTSLAQAQIEYGMREHERHFGVRPDGIWLPECAYAPHLSKLLQHSGIRYFIVDQHALQHAEPMPVNDTFVPIATEDGVYAFPRDAMSSHQVWSSHEGYPGDPDYREYYRDIGFDLGWYDEDEWNYIKPHLLADGARINTGLKYYRITGSNGEKQPYCPEWARARTVEHARHFIHSRIQQLRLAKDNVNGIPIVLCPYDAELFGHWWYEGPQWIEAVFREWNEMQELGNQTLSFVSPLDYVNAVPHVQQAAMSMSSWGRGGYAEVWLQEKNDWIYKLLHKAEEELFTVLQRHANDWGYSNIRERLANQSIRELMLAAASDWAFILDADTVPSYAIERTNHHLERCRTLLHMLEYGIYNLTELEKFEADTPCFPTLDYRVLLHAMKNEPTRANNKHSSTITSSSDHQLMLSSLFSYIRKQLPVTPAHQDANDRNSHTENSAGKKKRILMLAWEFPPLVIGGLSRAVYDLSRYLVKRDCEIHIVTREVPDTPLYEKMDGIHVHRVPLAPSMTEIGFMDWIFQMNASFTICTDALITEGIHFDFIHAHDWLVYLAAQDLKEAYQLPLVVTIHATEHGRNHGAIHTDMQQRIHEMEYELTQKAEHVIVCSQAMKREVERIFDLPPMKVSVIPNGVECVSTNSPTAHDHSSDPTSLPVRHTNIDSVRAFRSTIAKPEDKIVFFIGRLVYEKGVQVLLSSLKLVQERIPNVKLVIAGAGPMASELKRLTAELGLSHCVHFTGFVNDEERDLLFDITDVSVFPSLYEPFGIVALEAMGRGVPIVVSDTGGLAEIIDHNQDGYKALCGHTESLAWHITDLLLHPDKAEQFAKQAYRKVTTLYDWDAISLSTRHVYEGVMAQ